MAPIRRILVPVDFSEHSLRAADLAVELAQSFGASVDLLHCYPIQVGGVSPYGVVIPESFDREVREAAERRLEQLRAQLADRGVAVEARVTPIFPSESISATAEELGSDLIVMGTRGLSGIAHVLLGSVAERTLRTAPCPVLTVKSEES